jgi:hypothetical protein
MSGDHDRDRPLSPWALPKPRCFCSTYFRYNRDMSDGSPRLPPKVMVTAAALGVAVAVALYVVLFPLVLQAADSAASRSLQVIFIAIPIVQISAMVMVPVTMVVLGRRRQAMQWFVALLICSCIVSLFIACLHALALTVS